MASGKNVHRGCDEKCPAYNNPSAEPSVVMKEDWEQFADATFERFKKRKKENAIALAAIPIHLLKEANQKLHPDYQAFKAGELKEPKLRSAAEISVY